MTKSKSISSPKLGEAFLQHFFTILAIFGFHNGWRMMIHSQENHVSSNKQQNFVLMAQSQLMKPRFSCHNLAPDGVFFDFLPIFRHFDDFFTRFFLILCYVFYLGEVGFKLFQVQNWFFCGKMIMNLERDVKNSLIEKRRGFFVISFLR